MSMQVKSDDCRCQGPIHHPSCTNRASRSNGGVMAASTAADRLRTIAEGPALDLPPVAWEPPNHISRRAVAEWDEGVDGGPSVYLTPTGTSWYPHPLIYIGDERLSVDQAEVAARHLLAAVAMAREVTR